MHKSKVKVLPFCIKLTRLSDAIILKYTTKQDKNVQKADTLPIAFASLHLKCLTIPVRKIKLNPTQSVTLHTPRSTKVDTASPQGINVNKSGKKKRLISGHPSKSQQHYTFRPQHHILKKHKTKTYLKCRIKDCKSAYVTYHSVCDLNTHHRTYHARITYNCQCCKKTLNTPTALKWHMYGHGAVIHTCDKCNKTFVYKSKLRLHKCTHLHQKLFQCCHGNCSKKYHHPQDLAQHTLTHTARKFECDLCEKTFMEKHLLKWHEVVHDPTNRYFCKICRKGFKHNNQLYCHRKICFL